MDTCGSCGAFTQPTWDTCKVCGAPLEGSGDQPGATGAGGAIPAPPPAAGGVDPKTLLLGIGAIAVLGVLLFAFVGFGGGDDEPTVATIDTSDLPRVTVTTLPVEEVTILDVVLPAIEGQSWEVLSREATTEIASAIEGSGGVERVRIVGMADARTGAETAVAVVSRYEAEIDSTSTAFWEGVVFANQSQGYSADIVTIGGRPAIQGRDRSMRAYYTVAAGPRQVVVVGAVSGGLDVGNLLDVAEAIVAENP